MCFTLSQRCSFTSMMVMTGSLFVVEIVVGYLTNSMALVADSFHMLSDLVSLVVGYMASRVTKRTKDATNPTGKYTFGWARAEVLGALVNAVFLVALCFSILVEAFKRIMLPEEIEDPKLVLIAGGIGLLVNIIGLLLFHQHGHSHGGHGHSHGGGGHGHNEKPVKRVRHNTPHDGSMQTIDYNIKPKMSSLTTKGMENGIQVYTSKHKSEIYGGDMDMTDMDPDALDAASLNVRGVYLHVLGDALGSVIVMISALIILYTRGDWTKYVDPSLSVAMVIIILKTSFPLLKESYMILMQTVPTHIKMTDIQERLCETVPGVLGVHEFHIWKLVGDKIIASAHVRCKANVDGMAVASQVKEFFHNEGIHSTTIQLEFVEVSSRFSGSFDCLLRCKDDFCSTKICCPEDKIPLPLKEDDPDLENGIDIDAVEVDVML